MQSRTKLEWLLTHEQKLAARYRYFISVVMVAPPTQELDLRSFFKNSVRDCDEFFSLAGQGAIVMAHTGLGEAKKAVDRYKQMCNGTIDLRFAIASYPGDVPAANLLEAAEERLDKAMQGAFGEVVVGST